MDESKKKPLVTLFRPAPGHSWREYFAEALPEDWAEMMIAGAAQGMSEYELMVNLRVTVRCWQRLKEDDPNFKEVYEQCKYIERAYWDKQGRDGIKDKNFNSYLFMVQMINRFGWLAKKNAEEGNAKRNARLEEESQVDTEKLDHLFSGGDGDLRGRKKSA